MIMIIIIIIITIIIKVKIFIVLSAKPYKRVHLGHLVSSTMQERNIRFYYFVLAAVLHSININDT